MARTAKNISFEKEMKRNQKHTSCNNIQKPESKWATGMSHPTARGPGAAAERAAEPQVRVLLLRLHEGPWE